MLQTNLPLPKKRPDDTPRNNVNLDNKANQGLYFNKFFDQWADKFAKVKEPTKNYDGGKNVWLKEFTKKETANTKTEADRVQKLALKLGGAACEYTTTGLFVTGMGLSHPVENGFLWHHTLGVPYLPGSSVKGMIRAWAKHWQDVDDKDIERIFGNDDKADDGASAGNIIVFDALPTEPLKLYIEVITPHTGDWRIATKPTAANAPADWISPVPIPFLAVKEGAKFQFAMAKRTSKTTDEDLEKAYKYLEHALKWIGAGAKTAVGFGRFENSEKAEAKKEAIEARRPPQIEDRVEIIAGNYSGRIGVVLKLFEYGDGMAQIKPDDGQGKIKGTIPLADLKRLIENN